MRAGEILIEMCLKVHSDASFHSWFRCKGRADACRQKKSRNVYMKADGRAEQMCASKKRGEVCQANQREVASISVSNKRKVVSAQLAIW